MSTQSLSFHDDPYRHFLQQQKYKENLIHIDKSSKFARKVDRLKNGLASAKVNMLNGAMMGFMVGGLFGSVIGIYSAFQTRRLITIPMSILVSGISFGFILGCGSVIRNDQIKKVEQHKLSQYIERLSEDQWLKVQSFNKLVASSKSSYF